MSDISKQLVDQVQSAIADKQPVSIQGGNTKAHLGRASVKPSNLISIRKHSGIVEYSPAELIMTARAGTTLAEIDDELERNNQIFAAGPRRFEGKATIGGSLASNQSGNARPWLGSFRDHVLGIKLINGKGEHLKFGGQVLKNVAGYDVSRLQAGAMGTLGVITEVSFKVLPKPAKMVTLSKVLDIFEATTLMNQLSGTAKPITGSAWFNRKLYIRLEGAVQAVDACEKRWISDWGMKSMDKHAANRFWQHLREHELSFFKDLDKPLWRFSVNAASTPLLPLEEWLFNWSGSQRWLRGDFSLEELTQLAKEQHGEVQLYSGGDRSQDVATENNPVVKTLISNVKRSLDPDSIFNPGRLYSWL